MPFSLSRPFAPPKAAAAALAQISLPRVSAKPSSAVDRAIAGLAKIPVAPPLNTEANKKRLQEYYQKLSSIGREDNDLPEVLEVWDLAQTNTDKHPTLVADQFHTLMSQLERACEEKLTPDQKPARIVAGAIDCCQKYGVPDYESQNQLAFIEKEPLFYLQHLMRWVSLCGAVFILSIPKGDSPQWGNNYILNVLKGYRDDLIRPLFAKETRIALAEEAVSSSSAIEKELSWRQVEQAFAAVDEIFAYLALMKQLTFDVLTTLLTRRPIIRPEPVRQILKQLNIEPLRDEGGEERYAAYITKLIDLTEHRRELISAVFLDVGYELAPEACFTAADILTNAETAAAWPDERLEALVAVLQCPGYLAADPSAKADFFRLLFAANCEELRDLPTLIVDLAVPLPPIQGIKELVDEVETGAAIRDSEDNEIAAEAQDVADEPLSLVPTTTPAAFFTPVRRNSAAASSPPQLGEAERRRRSSSNLEIAMQAVLLKAVSKLVKRPEVQTAIRTALRTGAAIVSSPGQLEERRSSLQVDASSSAIRHLPFG